MTKYFTVSVKFKRENDKGKVKTVTERYLVDSMSVTEAEARVVQHLESCPDDYQISSASESRILEVISTENGC
jgi:hypothetical protein